MKKSASSEEGERAVLFFPGEGGKSAIHALHEDHSCCRLLRRGGRAGDGLKSWKERDSRSNKSKRG